MLVSMPDTRCPDCRHAVPAGRWCNRCGTPLEDGTAQAASGPATPSWVPRVLAASGAAAIGGVLLWGGAPSSQPRDASPEGVDSAVVLADDARPALPPDAGPSVSPVPPGRRTNVLCSDLKPRSVPTADLDTDEPGELVQLGDRTCVVMRPEGVTVP